MNAKAETVIDNDTGLEIPQAAKDSIAKLNTVEAGVAAMLKKYAAAPDASTPEGYELAKSEAKEIAAVRISADKAHKIAKAPYWEGGKRIDAMKKSIVDRISPLEDVRKEAIKAVDDEKARIEREAAEKEQARIEFIETRVKHISEHAQFVTLEQVNGALTSLGDIDFSEFDEFADIAREKASEATAALTERRDALKAQAEEAARLEAQRKEQEEAAAKLAEQQAEIERQQKEIDDAKAAQEAEDRRREQEKVDAEKARIVAINVLLNEIKEMPLKATSLRAGDYAKKALIELRSTLPSFEEYEDMAKEAISVALESVEQKLELFRAEAEAAEAKRLADIEAAKQQAIADEQARVKKEQAAEARKKAKAEKLAALAPDQEKLQKWIDSIPEYPALSTNDAKNATNKLDACLDQMQEIISSISADESQAA